MSPEGVDAARDRLLDAAQRCFERWGPAKTTLDDIADEAHVSRATVYRYLRSRVDLIIDLNLRAQQRSLGSLDARFGGRDAGSHVVEMLLSGRDWVQQFGEPGLAHTLAESERFVAHSRASYRALLERLDASGHLRAGMDLDQLVDWILFVRVAVWSDDTSTRAGLRGLLERYFLPAFVESD
jgi:AcrR family transcriptional regulator